MKRKPKLTSSSGHVLSQNITLHALHLDVGLRLAVYLGWFTHFKISFIIFLSYNAYQ